MTRYEACISKGWEPLGLAYLLVARIRGDGDCDFAVLLVDTCCLGVKDAYYESGVTEADLRDYLETKLPPDDQERIHPACAKKLIDGAVAYAESLGFAPHRDFRKARKILSGLDAALCLRDFSFGRDGRPCYIRGPDDSEERVDRVLAVLAARFGEDGYDYEDPSGEPEDDALDVRNDLLAWLEGEPDEVPRFYELCGLLTAMLICPTALSPTKVFGVLWGPDGRVWEDKEEMQEFADLLMAYWNQLNDLVHAAAAPDAHPDEKILDIWQEDFDADEEIAGLAMAVATFAWAKGFRRAVDLWPEAWGDALTRPDLAPHWEVVGWWADFDVKENRDSMIADAESETPRTLNPSVKALARALRFPARNAL